jgi:hypothetical protein
VTRAGFRSSLACLGARHGCFTSPVTTVAASKVSPAMKIIARLHSMEHLVIGMAPLVFVMCNFPADEKKSRDQQNKEKKILTDHNYLLFLYVRLFS